MRLRVLVVDDEKLSRLSTTKQLQAAGYEAEDHESPFSALKSLEQGNWDLVLTDLRMPGMDGLEFQRQIKARAPDTVVILMTAHATVQTAVEAMREGAMDYLTKPFDFEELGIRLERLQENLSIRRELAHLRRALGQSLAHIGLVGNAPAIRRVFDLIEQFADNPSNVLIVGETGTGKELVARALHARSAYANGPFVTVSSTTIPRELAESELFGHEAGAFTGASRQRKGKVELARGGTLFLDDVDDLPLELQGKLLRVLQEKEFERVGGDKSLQADMRTIAATKYDLERLAGENRFREDLMYRLNVLVIDLPPLRDRRGDVLLLARHFLETIARERNQEPRLLSTEAAERLMSYDWPGNVRQLRHAMESALALSRGKEIKPEDLPGRIQEGKKPAVYSLSLEDEEKIDLRRVMEDVEQELISWAMEKAGGNQGKAADILGVPRTTLRSKRKVSKGDSV